MERVWSGRSWSVRLEERRLLIEERGKLVVIGAGDAARLTARRSWFRWELHRDGARVARLRGLRRRDALAISFAPMLWAALDWAETVVETTNGHLTKARWIPRETLVELERTRPDASFGKAMRRARAEATLSEHEHRLLRLVRIDLADLVAKANETIAEAEWNGRREFFNSIESSPLTAEQGRAVLCFDNRVQVVAAAGSGKTSVMVARAAYAVDRGFVPPDRILLLAFNKAAAKELQERVNERLAAAGIDSNGIRAATFHSFGLDVIGKATGAKPRVAPWLDNGGDLRMVERIVDDLRDSSPEFRYRWDLYRLLFASTSITLNGGDHDAYDRATRTTGFRTFNGEVVKSHGERLIADWLYLNGVEYKYEQKYPVPLADSEHSQYRPDFYYPRADLWHEHWALDRDGRPPREFVGYTESMVWKRKVHEVHGTKLIETTWASIVHGDGLAELQHALESHGIRLDWNPDRQIKGSLPVKHEDLVRLVRSFMTHVKSGSLDREAMSQRLRGGPRHLRGFRSQMFLDIYWPVHQEWNRRLRAEGYVDFEDMLLLAADALESSRYEAPFDLILVDEFQDASQARARLVRGLVRNPGKYLLAVGDDWQSINRFAGADVSVMTSFQKWFGDGQLLQLTTTFRNPQSIADTAGAFVSKNPRQIRKHVRSFDAAPGEPVRVIRTPDLAASVERILSRLDADIESGIVAAGRSGRVSVKLLGRYRFDQELMPDHLWKFLDVSFMTAHASKGLEADYVILPRMISGKYGFPSEVADDPILDLAAPEPDPFQQAEERRLFYVALTRARREVTLVTMPNQQSRFVTELIAAGGVRLLDAHGNDEEEVRLCKCGRGTLVLRTGPHGSFYGCSTFPACTHTQSQ